MASLEGGETSSRCVLTSRFHLLCQPNVTTASIRRIYTTILGGFFSAWPVEVRRLASKIVEATKQCYDRIASDKLPTPDKSHYTFNLRDFGKVVQGMLQVTQAVVADRDAMLRLWLHEVSRVFHDRLVDDADKRWWWQTLRVVAETEFEMEWKEEYEMIVFGDYMRRENRVYEEVTDIHALQDKLVEFQMAYNVDNNKETELVFFTDAVHHLSRICRICRQPRGNALLVGVGGSGRQSLVRLAAYMCGMPLHQIAITRSYDVKDFRENLKEILLESGCENKAVVFMLSDSQILREQFLEDINNILNTGEVPNLMEPEDYDKIIESCRKFVKAAGKQESRNVIIQQFVQQCRDNVKIVLTMSPVGEQFRRRLRMFPSLVNCMSIDWFTKWPAEALQGLAVRALDKIDADDQTKMALANMCVQIHTDVQTMSEEFFQELRRHNYTTPTSYLELLSSYTRMLEQQENILLQQIKRYQGGLDKLLATQTLVDEMKAQLKQMQPVLEQAAKDTEMLMEEVNKKQKEAEVVKGECKAEEEAAGAIKAEADGVRAECQAELDKAMPAFYGAVEALNALSPRDINEIKAFAKPPEKVKMVLEAVLILLQERDTSWERAKVVMTRPDFINLLKDYKKDDISERTIRQLQKVIANNPDFTPEIVEKTSFACKSLCKWVLAIDNYYSVGRTIQPKKDRLAKAEARLAEATASLNAAQARLADVEGRVAALQKQMGETVEKKKNLEAEIKLTELRLQRAEKLMSGLASEQVRWAQQVSRLTRDQSELVGTIVLAAGCVAYLGPFTAHYRKRMVESWTTKCQELNIPVSSRGFSLADIADPVKARLWAQKGLPLDSFSVENAVILTSSRRFCLCIDPQGQANSWIRAMERDNTLKIIKLTEPNYMRTLENAIKVGLPVLLENVEETLDAVIDPVLLRQTYRSQGRTILKLGDQEVDYDENFKFYITTKLPNPHYMPELQIRVTILNFTVTQKGLEEQLLADVVRFERADLEQRADRTVVEIADGKAQLKDIEERILSLLASSTGNILDNETLINTLADAKKTSESVTQALEVSEATQRDITAARDRYRPVATRGSLIYTVIAEISGIDHMYQYSLEFFKRLFLQTLHKTEQSDVVEHRVATLLPAVTLDSYNTICRGLFEKDKQLFVFLMVSHIRRESGEISQEEWSFFLKGSEGQRVLDFDEHWPEWTTENAWNDIAYLSTIRGMEEVKNMISDSEADWGKWVQSDTAATEFPSGAKSLSPWHKLLLLRVFREDLVLYGVTSVVGHYLGKAFTESPNFDLEASFQDSTNISPIIFVLSPGTDPTATFSEFAEKKGFGEKKLMLSLGQDQGPKAQDMINSASRSGYWVYLQNCHVYASWMPSLERILEDIMLREVHKDFRLWLTTMPTTAFPVLVLQSGIKVTKEPPRGLKANIKDSFLLEVTPELWDSCKNPRPWKRLLFSLTYLHAIIQERRKFGPLGWNIPYEWNQSDFSASVKSLFTYVSNYDTVQWPALKYMIGVINYGGRVTDFLDSRCLQTIMMKFFNPDVVGEGVFPVTSSGVYCIPAEVNDINTVKEYLGNLPPFETPELFGLHPNADITYNRSTSRKQLDTVLSIQPRSKSSGSMSTDDKVLNIAIDFQSRIPALINKKKGHEDTYRITESGAMTSLGTVVSQEVDVFNRINEKLQSTLTKLQRAIKGEVVMDARLESMYTAFLLGKVPEIWHEGGYLSLKGLASWMDDTINRIEFLRDWNDNGPPLSYWVPGFFFPQGFLTGVLQTHSRTYKIPIDDIKFRTHVLAAKSPEEIVDAPETGVYVHGLFLEGATWNRETMTLDESTKGELFVSMPLVWLEPVLRSEATDRVDTYSCPLYKTSSRAGALSTTGLSTNYVLSLDLPAGSRPTSHWIMRGVAMLCMLDD